MSWASKLSQLFKRISGKAAKKTAPVVDQKIVTSISSTGKVTSRTVTTNIRDIRGVVKASGKTAGKFASWSAGKTGTFLKWVAGGGLALWLYQNLDNASNYMVDLTGLPKSVVVFLMLAIGVVVIAYLLSVVTGVRRKTGLTTRRRRYY